MPHTFSLCVCARAHVRVCVCACVMCVCVCVRVCSISALLVYCNISRCLLRHVICIHVLTEASRLASGAVFKLWFPNYSVQSCPSVTSLNKQGVNRTSISCRSLDWVMGTFQLPNYTTIEGPLNSLGPAPASLWSSWTIQIHLGSSSKSWFKTFILHVCTYMYIRIYACTYAQT